jgi:hypothetical protein
LQAPLTDSTQFGTPSVIKLKLPYGGAGGLRG